MMEYQVHNQDVHLYNLEQMPIGLYTRCSKSRRLGPEGGRINNHVRMTNAQEIGPGRHHSYVPPSSLHTIDSSIPTYFSLTPPTLVRRNIHGLYGQTGFSVITKNMEMKCKKPGDGLVVSRPYESFERGHQ